jgi:hypothetical protein
MEVCPNCFADKELKGFISSSTSIGHCNICSSDTVPLLNIKELLDFFQELISNFVKAAQGEPLRTKIQGAWSFFSTHSISTKILNEVLPQLTTAITSSDDLVEYQADINDNIRHWDILKEELKWSRRYISDISRLEDLGWDAYFNTQYQLKTTDELYRARLHHESGLPAFTINQMMCPPKHLTTGGRANPSGIPFLYLSDNPNTVLYEVRAAYLDELTIGVFKLEDHIGSIKIVDFTEDTSLFQPGKVNETIKGRLLRSIISRDLSKPMRRYDSDIEYIATQFICEFIKIFTGASGIKFSSSLHPSGTNLVIFDQSLMTCTKVILKKINHLDLKSINI